METSWGPTSKAGVRSGEILIDGHDIIKEFRKTREMIGLVPQELTTDAFETVWNTVSFTRGLFGKEKNPALIEDILKNLTLWDKKDSPIMTLSGGMKRRVLIAKALSHEPEILFLDEPTAGVDVVLRKDMWTLVDRLRERGTTIILTTHYIEEAEQIADRIGVINRGEIIIVEEKNELMAKMGKKILQLNLTRPISNIPPSLKDFNLTLKDDGQTLTYIYDARGERTGITGFLKTLSEENIKFRDLNTKQSSLEEIFVELVKQQS